MNNIIAIVTALAMTGCSYSGIQRMSAEDFDFYRTQGVDMSQPCNILMLSKKYSVGTGEGSYSVPVILPDGTYAVFEHHYDNTDTGEIAKWMTEEIIEGGKMAAETFF
jgi:major membrane immunogen (membrane-anchored lipoprotein)